MAGLKVFVNVLSQPSRAILIFLRAAKIPYEEISVDLKSGAHFDEEYKKNVHRFCKVPAIIDNGVNVIESIAILRYLSRKYTVDDHWYPKDALKQAKVDEFLEWQHISCRAPLSMFFQTKFIRPMVTGQPANEGHVNTWKQRMEDSLTELENIWLAKSPYLVGDKITIADIIGACEVEQPRMAGYEPREGRPRIAAWLERVRKDLSPHYDDVHAVMNKISSRHKGQPPSDFSKI